MRSNGNLRAPIPLVGVGRVGEVVAVGSEAKVLMGGQPVFRGRGRRPGQTITPVTPTTVGVPAAPAVGSGMSVDATGRVTRCERL